MKSKALQRVIKFTAAWQPGLLARSEAGAAIVIFPKQSRDACFTIIFIIKSY